MGYGVWEVPLISLQKKLVEAPNPWVLTGYGLLKLWVKTDLMYIVCWAYVEAYKILV